MKNIKDLKFKIESARAMVKATTLKNAVNLSILIHNNGETEHYYISML